MMAVCFVTVSCVPCATLLRETVDSIDRMVLPRAVSPEYSSHLAELVMRRDYYGHDDTPDDERVSSF